MKKVKSGDSSTRSPSSGDPTVQRNKEPGMQASQNPKPQSNNVIERLKELETRSADDLPIDTKRINEMKNAIANGEYQVDAESIANKMIDFESSLKK